MGSAVFEIGEALGARGNIKAKKLKGGGTLFFRVEKALTRDSGRLKLQIRGVKMKNVDGFLGKSDPFWEISKSIRSPGGQTWQVIHRSKHVLNDLNPVWEPTSLSMNDLCDGDKSKAIRISVFDWDKKGKHSSMGFFETSVDGLIHATTTQINAAGITDPKKIDTSKAFRLTKRGKFFGFVVVTQATLEGYQAPASSSPSHATAPSATTTGAGAYVSGAAPAAAAAASSSQSTYQPTSEAVNNGVPFAQALDHPPPESRPIPAATKPGAGPPPPVYTAAAAGTAASVPFVAAVPMTTNPTPVAAYPAASLPTPVAPPPPPRYAAQTNQTNKPSFIDYLSGGLELQLSIAIDFTGSNGDPRRPGTLHYIHRDGQLNGYEKAISAVGGVVGRYDHDQKFGVLGFGAKYSGVINHCFQVGPTPEAQGLQGVLQAYRGVFRTGLTMSGPTVFAEVIDLAAAQARAKQNQYQGIGKQAYHILLILTDGAVTDVNRTKHAIQEASDAPLSIVIVGIGHADFTAMQFLDDFQSNGGAGGIGTRDICQFVEFEKHKNNKIGLTQATLDEIPDQLVEYFHTREIAPLPEIHGSRLSLMPEDYNEDVDIDLNVEINEYGEINLADDTGAYYDDTQYGTYGNLEAIPPPPPPSAPPLTPQAFVPPGAAAGRPQAYVPGSPSPPGPYGVPPPNPYLSTPPPPHPYGAPPPGAPQGYDAQPSFRMPGHVPPPPVVQQGQPYNPSAPVRASIVQPPPQAFYVQVPPGVQPGQQIQITNPATQQPLVIAVPPGIPPGGTFPVSYY